MEPLAPAPFLADSAPLSPDTLELGRQVEVAMCATRAAIALCRDAMAQTREKVGRLRALRLND